MTTTRPRILLIGTADTKSPELAFLRDCILQAGAEAVFMDIGILARGTLKAEIPNDAVAAAANSTLPEIAELGDENLAMARMAEGAARLASRYRVEGRIDGMLALGGTMGTDLALDVASALPLGFPKFIVSTIAYSHLIPPERVSPDLMMILWAGGLYGLNDICRSSLAQAAGAVVGACRVARRPAGNRPLIGMTSLGKSCLRYMEYLLPALEARGYDIAVFHTTGMGGRAFETLAASGAFAAVMDFSLQELANHCAGSIVTAGADRLQGAGRRGTPQIVAPGAIDMIDFPTWRENRWGDEGRNYHAHNRLLASVSATGDERRRVARHIAEKLSLGTGPTVYIVPRQGIEGWDREGEPMHAPQALAAFLDETRRVPIANVRLIELDAHINDVAFAETALEVLDDWVTSGLVRRGRV
ncbi:Tm-1-like ATP-binding domain-containing protein [Bradyrhizobium sp.]|uniref:Tm-1-like ATP-binding domain-containing protein n=1 Tax=Bradyrhizobium sp. TaxID=376 RepID=UPI002628BF74|nr:Tm-1-like ATP-binding domain-containing protein [Bradyrhizobium sp.]